jgi:hypothetical protein
MFDQIRLHPTSRVNSSTDSRITRRSKHLESSWPEPNTWPSMQMTEVSTERKGSVTHSLDPSLIEQLTFLPSFFFSLITLILIGGWMRVCQNQASGYCSTIQGWCPTRYFDFLHLHYPRKRDDHPSDSTNTLLLGLITRGSHEVHRGTGRLFDCFRLLITGFSALVSSDQIWLFSSYPRIKKIIKWISLRVQPTSKVIYWNSVKILRLLSWKLTSSLGSSKFIHKSSLSTTWVEYQLIFW